MHMKCIAEERFRRASMIDLDSEKAAGSSASEAPLAVVECVPDSWRGQRGHGGASDAHDDKQDLRPRNPAAMRGEGTGHVFEHCFAY